MYGKFVPFDDILAGKVRRTGIVFPRSADFGRYRYCLSSILGTIGFGDVQQCWFDDR
jgi:hypothetical protein